VVIRPPTTRGDVDLSGRAGQLVVDEAAIVWNALSDWRGSSADFSDALVTVRAGELRTLGRGPQATGSPEAASPPLGASA